MTGGWREADNRPRVNWSGSPRTRTFPTRSSLAGRPASWPSQIGARTRVTGLGLVGQLEQCGTLVMVSDIYGSNSRRSLNPAEFKSIALFDPVAPVLFLNSRDRPDRQIFTLVHALAHLWLGQSALCAPAVESREEPDRWADEVAAEVLAPRASAEEQDRPVPQAFLGDPNSERGFHRHVELRAGGRFTRALLAGWRQGIASESEAIELLGIKEPRVLCTLAERLGID